MFNYFFNLLFSIKLFALSIAVAVSIFRFEIIFLIYLLYFYRPALRKSTLTEIVLMYIPSGMRRAGNKYLGKCQKCQNY